MSKKKGIDDWIRSSKFIALAKVYNIGINFVSFIILARILQPTDFGVWALFMTLVATIGTARISLIRSAYIRFRHQTKDYQREGLQASAFAMSMFITVVLSVLFVVMAPYIADWLNSPQLTTMLRLYPLMLFATTIFSQCEMALAAAANFRLISYMYMIRKGLFFLAVLFFWVMHITPSTVTLMLTYLVSISIITIIALRWSRSILTISLKNYRELLPQLWKYGRFVFGTNLSAQLFRSADAYLTAAMISPAISGLYNACIRISNLVDMPSNVLADIAFVRAAKIKAGDNQTIKNTFEKTTAAIMVFSIPALLVLLIFPELILRIIAGENYVQAAPILRITAFFGFILPFMKQYGIIMDATGTPDINFKTNLLSLVMNIVFNVAGIHLFGFYGAAIGTAATFLCTFIITQRILYKKFNVSIKQVFINTYHFYGVLFNMAKRYLNGLPMLKRHSA